MILVIVGLAVDGHGWTKGDWFLLGAEAKCHLLEGHTWTLWYWCVLLMTFSAWMLKQ